jgi:hypothetical protein
VEKPSVSNKASTHYRVEDSSCPVPERPTASGLVLWHKAEAPEARYHVRFLRYCGHSLAYGYGAKLPTALLQAQFPDGAKFLISAPSGEFWPVSPCSLFDSIILATSSEIVAKDHAR